MSISDNISSYQRRLEGLYANLDWPSSAKSVTFITQVAMGRGDMAAAAKMIGLIDQMHPDLTFNWIVTRDKVSAEGFLPASLKNRVSLTLSEERRDEIQTDLLVLGPNKKQWSREEIQRDFQVIPRGAIVHFLENASPVEEELPDPDSPYESFHSTLFSPARPVAMGLLPGSGIIIDRQRASQPLAQTTHDPSLIAALQDNLLKQQIEEAGPVSINSGYAHHFYSHRKFIDASLYHEKERDLLFVLNQKGDYFSVDVDTFVAQHQLEERRPWLEECDYRELIVQEADRLVKWPISKRGSRRITVILRPSFGQSDLKLIQLASERLLATGDNSAAEAWEARCRLFVYEDIHNGGCKARFLDQQVALAVKIYPPLAKWLRALGSTHDVIPFETRADLKELLDDPTLSDKTLEFCEDITQKFVFEDVIRKALKRALWHSSKAELIATEIECLDESWRESVRATLAGQEASDEGDLSALKERIAELATL